MTAPTIFDSNDTPLSASGIGNPYLFTGRRFDPESGNYYYRARIYSPTLGRFLQTDPLGYVDGLNLYAYVGNNPVNWRDPSGQIAVVDDLAILGLLGAAGIVAASPPVQEAAADAAKYVAGAVKRFPENAANVYGQVKDFFMPPEEIPPVPGTPANTEPIDTTEQLIPPDISDLLGPLPYPEGDLCPVDGQESYPRREPEKGDNITADPISEPVAPQIVVSEGTPRPEGKYLKGKKHGLKWTEGPATAKSTGKPQGQWGSKEDLEFAAEKAGTLAPGESDWFELPAGHDSVVHLPDGTTVPAGRIWIRNNGTGTFHGYPAL